MQFCHIYEYDTANYPTAMDMSDLLRSGILLAVSSLDLLVHSLYRAEVVYRLQNSIPIDFLEIPYNCLISDPIIKIQSVDTSIKSSHSFKSFVAPDKIAEILRHFVADPWTSIAVDIGEDKKDTKSRLRQIIDWRNRIAHEADINPNYGGIDLWPISKLDTESSIKFIEKIGTSIVKTVELSH
jgi:hypothetical protein